MSSLSVLFSMTVQTDGVWPLVWGVEDPAMTYSRADVAEWRPHSTGIVQTLRIEKEIGRETDRHTLAAFVLSLSVEMFGLRVVVFVSLFPFYSAVSIILGTGTFVTR